MGVDEEGKLVPLQGVGENPMTEDAKTETETDEGAEKEHMD